MAESRYARAESRIVSVCEGALDGDFREVLLRELRTCMHFDAYVWLLTDPTTTVGSAPLADVPALHELPTLIKLKYLTPVNRWTNLASTGVKAASLAAATNGNLSRSLVWEHILRRHAVTDVASTIMADRFGCWGFLDLWRTGSSIFTDEEIRLLASIAEPVTTALRKRSALTFDAIPASVDARTSPTVLLLDDDLHMHGQTPASDAQLRILLPNSGQGPPIPASAYNVAAQLLANEKDVDAHEPWARVHRGSGTWLTVSAARVGDRIAVTLETSTPDQRLEVFALSHAFSARETQILDLLADGSDTRQIASRMHLSELTVQDHLKSLFAKSGTHNRRTLLARILGTHS